MRQRCCQRLQNSLYFCDACVVLQGFCESRLPFPHGKNVSWLRTVVFATSVKYYQAVAEVTLFLAHGQKRCRVDEWESYSLPRAINVTRALWRKWGPRLQKKKKQFVAWHTGTVSLRHKENFICATWQKWSLRVATPMLFWTDGSNVPLMLRK